MRYGRSWSGVCLALVSVCAVSCSSSDMGSPSGSGGGSGTGGSGGASGPCAALTGYVATTSTAPSFANDIYPILSNPSAGTAASPSPGCGQTILCHGDPATAINKAGTVTLSFVDSAAMVKSALLANAVNAPSMKRVDPGHVGSSFLAYKISGAAAIACVNSSCPANVTVGNTQPCGDPMPNANGAGVAQLTSAEVSKILDWIALGAHD